MIGYLNDYKLSFRELSRIIELAREAVAECGRVFELEDGQVWWLECNHCVTTMSILFHLTPIYEMIVSQTACRSYDDFGKPVNFMERPFLLVIIGKRPRRLAESLGCEFYSKTDSVT